MPNWCITDITFEANPNYYDEAIQALHNLYNKIECQAYGDSSLMENGFGPKWLGNFALMFKLCTAEEIDNGLQPYRCRGSINYIEEDVGEFQDSFYITQNDAWSPNLAMWQEIINRYYSKEGVPLINIYYMADEPGCEIYDTNDDSGYFYQEKGYIDAKIPFIPNIFPFVTQAPNSPFMKVNMDIINNNYVYYNNGCDKYNYDEPSIKIYQRFENQNTMLQLVNEIFLNKPVDNIESAYNECQKLDNQLHDYAVKKYEELKRDTDKPCVRYIDPFINSNLIGYSSIEDMDPVRDIKPKIRTIKSEPIK